MAYTPPLHVPCWCHTRRLVVPSSPILVTHSRVHSWRLPVDRGSEDSFGHRLGADSAWMTPYREGEKDACQSAAVRSGGVSIFVCTCPQASCDAVTGSGDCRNGAWPWRMPRRSIGGPSPGMPRRGRPRSTRVDCRGPASTGALYGHRAFSSGNAAWTPVRSPEPARGFAAGTHGDTPGGPAGIACLAPAWPLFPPGSGGDASLSTSWPCPGSRSSTSLGSSPAAAARIGYYTL